ncbi:hypothetical protein [Nocardia thraciensis]
MIVQPTPWQENKFRHSPVAAHGNAGRGRPGLRAAWRAIRSALAGQWGYLGAAVGSAAVLALLFEPWLIAGGFDGKVRIDAFGRMDATTLFMNSWAHSPPDLARVHGYWGILTAAAGTHTLLVTLVNLRLRTAPLARLVTISAGATSVSALTTLIYLNSKAPEVKAMVGLSGGLGGQIGWLMSDYFGTSTYALPGSQRMSYANAGLTSWALAAAVVAVASSAAATTQWIHGARDRSDRSSAGRVRPRLPSLTPRPIRSRTPAR